MAYVPSQRTFSVDMSQFSGPATTRWYDPTSGTYLPITGSPFANAGTQTFTPPGGHSDGTTDWVLVMESAGSSGISAPIFTVQPVGVTATAGSDVTFTAAATGTPAPSFQWLKNGATIAGATGASYSLKMVTTNDAATYSVVATNPVGSATSNGAMLVVNAVASGGTTPPPGGGPSTSAPTTPSTANPATGGSGGAIGSWFALALTLLAVARGLTRRE
jgi:hypothetical protein